MNGEHKKPVEDRTEDHKFTPEFKDRWVEALRSGKYAQGRTVLRNSERQFCCLGVACDLIDSSRWAEIGREMYKGVGFDWGECKCEMADEKVAEAIGIPERFVLDLAHKNDAGATFEVIAKWIERNL